MGVKGSKFFEASTECRILSDRSAHVFFNTSMCVSVSFTGPSNTRLRYCTDHGALDRVFPGHTSPVVTRADNMPSTYKLPELWICGNIYPLILKQSSQQGREAKRAIPNLADNLSSPTWRKQPSPVLHVHQGVDGPVGINKLDLGPSISEWGVGDEQNQSNLSQKPSTNGYTDLVKFSC